MLPMLGYPPLWRMCDRGDDAHFAQGRCSRPKYVYFAAWSAGPMGRGIWKTRIGRCRALKRLQSKWCETSTYR